MQTEARSSILVWTSFSRLRRENKVRVWRTTVPKMVVDVVASRWVARVLELRLGEKLKGLLPEADCPISH